MTIDRIEAAGLPRRFDTFASLVARLRDAGSSHVN